MNSEQTERHLRYFIIGLLHVGRLKRGDPLPSIRSVAKQIGADHRAVASAYRQLEAEGLVEIRPGSGVYLASDLNPGLIQTEMGRWLSGVLLDGWSRRLSRTDVASLVARGAGAPLRVACIESNEDHMVAVAAELENDFSLRVLRVMVSPDADADAMDVAALAEADLVATTVFHADAARTAAALAGKPLIALRMNSLFAAEIAAKLAGGDVTAVIADDGYRVRGQAHLDVTPHRGRVRFVPVDALEPADRARLERRRDGIVATRAARRRLGLDDYHLVPSPPTYISPESARELCECIVELGLRAVRPTRGG